LFQRRSSDIFAKAKRKQLTLSELFCAFFI